MKKFILFYLMVTAGIANAGGFGSVEYSSRDGVNGTADSNAYKVTIGTTLNDNLKVDLSNRFKQNDGTNTNDTRIEGGLTYQTPLTSSFSVYTRAALGEKFTSTKDFSYYSIEPGVKYSVTPDLSVKAAYRYRNAVDSANQDKTNAIRLGTEYSLTKNYSVGLGFDRVRGDSDYNAVNVILGMKF